MSTVGSLAVKDCSSVFFLILNFSYCCIGMAMSQAQRLAAPRQRSRGGSASLPNPKLPLAAPLHLLERRSPLLRPHLKLTSKPKIQPQATSRRPAAKLISLSSPRDLCRRGGGGPLRRTNNPSPNQNPPSLIPIFLNL